MSNSLPQGWASCTLADIAAVNPKTVADESLIAGFVPMSHAPTSYHGELLFDEKPWGEIKKSYTNFQDGDVIFAKVTPCFENGKAAIVDDLPNGIGAGSSEFYVLRPHCNDISQQLLFALIKTHAFMQEGATNMTGAVGLRRVPKSFVETFPIALPSAAEQKKISDRLDKLLTQVEATQARLARIPDIIKQFRQSVLAAAVSGKLSEEWRGDSSYSEMDLNLEKTDKFFYIPTTWTKIRFSDACQIISGYAFKRQDFLNEGKVPAIKISNVQYGQFEVKNQQFLPVEHLEIYKKFVVIDGDLLMALTRPITNDTLKVCRYPSEQPTGILNQRVAKFIFKNENEKAFFELLFQSYYFKVQVLDKLSETLQPNLSPVDLKKFIIATPNELEQAEIVRRVEQLFAYADNLEQQAKAAKARVDNLTQAILAKAFRGELTADWRAANPDLISGDNSAAALLARIQAERATAKPHKRATKKTAA
ncbi:MAG: restriction endonuclease subunit S [Aeromonas sp.]